MFLWLELASIAIPLMMTENPQRWTLPIAGVCRISGDSGNTQRLL
ncbi:MAG TPA: hypothetical protein V6C65_26785 [Allocoleopsis sp.]